jgi:hypothetical protein
VLFGLKEVLSFLTAQAVSFIGDCEVPHHVPLLQFAAGALGGAAMRPAKSSKKQSGDYAFRNKYGEVKLDSELGVEMILKIVFKDKR